MPSVAALACRIATRCAQSGTPSVALCTEEELVAIDGDAADDAFARIDRPDELAGLEREIDGVEPAAEAGDVGRRAVFGECDIAVKALYFFNCAFLGFDEVLDVIAQIDGCGVGQAGGFDRFL